jgi:hypothetical protein
LRKNEKKLRTNLFAGSQDPAILEIRVVPGWDVVRAICPNKPASWVEKLMKRCTCLVAALLIGALGSSPAQAVVYFEDNFDSYANQSAFEAVWTPVGCSLSGLPTNCGTGMESNTLSQDFPERGNTLLNSSPATPAPATISAADRNQIILTPAQTPPVLGIGDKVIFSFDFFDLDAFSDGTLGSPYRQNVHLQYRNPDSLVFETGTGQLIGMGMNNNQLGGQSGGQYYMGRVLGYDPRNAPAPSTPPADPDGGPEEAVGGSGAYFKMNDFSTGTGTGPGSRPPTTADWHNFKVEVTTDDGLSQDYAFYVDDQLAERVSNVGTSLRQYNVIRIGSGLSSTVDAYYDNVKLEFIPGVVPPANDADFNEDGVIDAGDYPVWRKYNPMASGATEATGDADGDGDNDDDDYLEWYETYGESSPTGHSGAVPEPAGVVMLLTGLAALAIRRRG